MLSSSNWLQRRVLLGMFSQKFVLRNYMYNGSFQLNWNRVISILLQENMGIYGNDLNC
jgi:hypothetical protein